VKKSTKVFLGITTLWPVVYFLIFFIFIFSTIFLSSFAPSPGEAPSGFPPAMAVIFGLHLLTMLVIMALTVFYMVDVFRNDRVEKDKKVLWAIVIFMGNAIAMPIYWYLYFWKEPSIANSPLPGQLNSANTSSWSNAANASRAQEQYVPPSQPPNWRE
jgi:hypothetical protein